MTRTQWRRCSSERERRGVAGWLGGWWLGGWVAGGWWLVDRRTAPRMRFARPHCASCNLPAPPAPPANPAHCQQCPSGCAACVKGRTAVGVPACMCRSMHQAHRVPAPRCAAQLQHGGLRVRRRDRIHLGKWTHPHGVLCSPGRQSACRLSVKVPSVCVSAAGADLVLTALCAAALLPPPR